MSRIRVGVIDYGAGNLASIGNVLQDAGFRVRISSDYQRLDECEVLMLPGVGAFPPAMLKLRSTGLDSYLRDAAQSGKAIIGICLGMQLLVQESLEQGHTLGLGILPGRVVPLGEKQWHIGWNTVECIGDDTALRSTEGECFYFNHSFHVVDAGGCVTAQARLSQPVTAAIRSKRVAGLQFHPEKSQRVGIQLLQILIRDIANA